MEPPAAGLGRAISVVVADDEPHVVTYLEALLHAEGFDVAGSAFDADGAVQLAHHLHPDVALLDLRMPGGGLEAARLIGSVSPTTRIVIFSSEADEADILPLLRAGVDGYVLKGCAPDRLAGAIRDAMAGNPYLAPEMNRFAVGQLASRLQAEEQEALQHLRRRERVRSLITGMEYRIVHQPMCDLETGEVVAVEALTRFTARPPRPPNEWFDDADRAGMRIPLELAVASAAIGDLADLRADLSVAVNLSPETVLSGRLPEVLAHAPLSRLIVEVTEHVAVADYAALNDALAPWRLGGARLAVDDAGGGYASFAHILNLSPELIKLDLTLTRDVHVDRQRQALVRALVAYADEMGVAVVAEGIETGAEQAELRRLGTHLGQGFHLGRPRPLDEQPELLATVDLDVGPAPAGLGEEWTAQRVLDEIDRGRG